MDRIKMEGTIGSSGDRMNVQSNFEEWKNEK